MMKPHCNYCGQLLEGKDDPFNVPCVSCVEMLQAKIKEEKEFYQIKMEGFILVIPKAFWQHVFLEDKLNYSFRNLGRKIRNYAKQFCTEELLEKSKNSKLQIL